MSAEKRRGMKWRRVIFWLVMWPLFVAVLLVMVLDPDGVFDRFDRWSMQ